MSVSLYQKKPAFGRDEVRMLAAVLLGSMSVFFVPSLRASDGGSGNSFSFDVLPSTPRLTADSCDEALASSSLLKAHIGAKLGLARLCVSEIHVNAYTKNRFAYALFVLHENRFSREDIYNPAGLLWLESSCCRGFTITEKVKRFVVGALALYAHALARGASVNLGAVALHSVRDRLPVDYHLPVQYADPLVVGHAPYVVIQQLKTFQERAFGYAGSVSPEMTAEFWSAIDGLDLCSIEADAKGLAFSASSLYANMYATIVDHQIVRLRLYQEALARWRERAEKEYVGRDEEVGLAQ